MTTAEISCIKVWSRQDSPSSAIAEREGASTKKYFCLFVWFVWVVGGGGQCFSHTHTGTHRPVWLPQTVPKKKNKKNKNKNKKEGKRSEKSNGSRAYL